MNNNLSVDKRHLARLLAVQYVFTKIKSEAVDQIMPFEPNTLLSEIEEKKFNTKLYESLVTGVEENFTKIDSIITKVAPSWPLDQINPVDLSILRLAIWEAFIGELNPVKVVINEAIEIAKVLSSKDSSSFINGVLASIYKNSKLVAELKND